jgi:hypothetical protein
MPVEMVVLSPVPPGLSTLLRAAAQIGPELTMRTTGSGTMHQLIRPTALGDTAVLSVRQPLEIVDRDEVTRLLPAGSVSHDLLAATRLWWVEACAPWGETGSQGVRVARAFAALLTGTCVVHDGR